MLFARQLKFIDDLEGRIFKEIENALNSKGYLLEAAITDDQLYNRGVDGNENPLRNKATGKLGYTRTTIRLKIAKGQPVDRVTLRDENEFHPSITIKGFAEHFEVSSNITYAKYIINRYGEDSVKPTLTNLSKFFLNQVLPNIKTNIYG